MKATLVLATVLPSAVAFAPTSSIRRTATQLAAFDTFDLSHVDSLSHFFSSLTLADLDAGAQSLAPPVVAATADTSTAVDAVTQTATAGQGSGWFGFLAGPIEGLLQLIHKSLTGMGMREDAWGVTIIAMTIVIKTLTFPLTKSQLESTNKMQALQPKIKSVQAKYQSNPEVMNQKVAEIYQTNDVNPLAGCIPSLVQIPVFIGLYRAVLTLAKENALDEPFLFLPNLEGPTYGADPAHASDWLLKNWVDGVPSLGWDDTAAFLSIPVFLVISQFVSMNLMQPKSNDPQQQQSNIVLKFLPLMIGWFSLNVPAALGIYWVVNNIVTTATTLYVRNTMPKMEIAGGGPAVASTTTVMNASTTDFNPTPMNERAVGFGGSQEGEVMTTITPIDAEIVEDEALLVGGGGTDISMAPKSKRGGSRKKKRKKRRKN